MNKLKYGKGTISISPDTDVRGFDIRYTGKMDGRVTLDANWVVIANNKRIIGFATGNSIITDTDILEYSGKINITSCLIANNDSLFTCDIVHDSGENLFKDSEEVFDSSVLKLNEMKKTDFSIEKSKTSLSHLNLLTKHNEYFFPDGTAVPEGTGYSIRLNPRQAFVSGNKPIYQKLSDNKLLNFKKVVKPKPIRLSKKAVKKLVSARKAKAGRSPGKSAASDSAPVAESPYYEGGGSD
tara:strand:- start:1437 stop:2153 length:717 start_codon:yes stop_codon:yes gene_type:complete